MKKTLFLLICIFSCTLEPEDDIIPPTAVIQYPFNGSSLGIPTLIKTYVIDDEALRSVTFIIDSIAVDTDYTAPYQYVWDVCADSLGFHSVVIRAEDTAGNAVMSDTSRYKIVATYDCGQTCGGDDTSCYGCMDSLSCNYNAVATMDSIICSYPDKNFDCAGNCTNDLSEGVCDCAVAVDECGICAGTNYFTDTKGDACMAGSSGDCLLSSGECDCKGNKPDECDVCGGTGIPEGECDCNGNVYDCSNICGGTTEFDKCGICGGGGPQFQCADTLVCTIPCP